MISRSSPGGRPSSVPQPSTDCVIEFRISSAMRMLVVYDMQGFPRMEVHISTTLVDDEFKQTLLDRVRHTHGRPQLMKDAV